MRLAEIERRLFEPIIDVLEAVHRWEDRRLGHGRLRTAVDIVGVVIAIIAVCAAFIWLEPKLNPPLGRYSAWGR